MFPNVSNFKCVPSTHPGFRFHHSAAGCVSALAGQWSESERAFKSDQAVLGHDVTTVYPSSMVLQLAGGKDGNTIRSLAETTGVHYLKLNAGTLTGYLKKKMPRENQRVFFSGKATGQQLNELHQKLEDLLSEVHQKMSQEIEGSRPVELLVKGLPADMGPPELEELVAEFGVIESIEPWDQQCLVTFSTADEAENAMRGLSNGANARGENFECQLTGGGPKSLSTESPQDAATLLVTNLPAGATTEEIESVFARIGQASVRFSREGTGEGHFCSVHLGSPYLAQLAKRQLQGYTLRKHRLHLTASDATGCATLFIGNLSYQATEASLLDLFSTAGSVADIRIVREGSDGQSCFGFVDFCNQLDSAKALEQLQGVSHMGRPLRLDEERVERVLSRCPPKRDGPWEAAGIFSTKGPRHGPDPRKLFVGNIGPEATDEDLYATLYALDGVTEVSIHRNKSKRGDFAFVWFASPEQAEAQMKTRKTRNPECAGTKLHLEWTLKERNQERKQQTICNLPPDTTAEELRKSLGAEVEVELSEGGSAQITASEKQLSKAEALIREGRARLRGHVLRIERRRPHLIIKNLASPDEAILRDACQELGELRRMKMIYNQDGEFKRCAFIEYMDANLVEDAREALHNSSLLGQRIRVERYRSLTPERRHERREHAEPRSPSLPPPKIPRHVMLGPPPPLAPYPIPCRRPPARPTSTPQSGPTKRPRPSVKPSLAVHLADEAAPAPKAPKAPRLAQKVQFLLAPGRMVGNYTLQHILSNHVLCGKCH
ncbi:unnamed protein product [Cladocopium goreaui]|uniref:Oligouridylate-binding protein 1A (AtUBP1a) (Polyuridylate-binding protein UBP1A) (Poly(U)-binding protein UBP1A) n=1 Tax=Cladocopium goreaui TaxID=2562237 RepID=A0A9P1BWU4_9DINO|nr:unnamed protein product [Cladocopium goreaui]